MTGGLSKTNRYLLAGAGVIGLLIASGTSAKATDVQQLEATMRAMQAQMAALQKEVQEAKAAAANSGGGDLDLKVKWKGAPELSSKDGKFKFKVRGRLQTDYNGVDQDTAITSFPDVSATELRRARLGIEGVMFYDWKYILEVDFANDSTAVKDAFLQYQGFKIADTPLLLRVGHFKTPNSLESVTSDLFLLNMERSAFVNAFEIERQIGAQVAYWSDHFGLAAGIFGDSFPSTTSAPLFTGFIGDEDLTFAARATVAPIHRDVNGVTQVLHFGASVRTRESGDDQSFFQYRARGADLHMTNFAVATGNIADSDTFWGLEAAALWGPFSVEGEYGHLDVDLPGGNFIRSNPPGAGQVTTTANPFIGDPDPSYDGWYVEGSWFFGGHRTYDNEGKFGRPKIDNPMFHGSGGWGALQVIGKYDVLNLSDTAFNNAGGCRTTQLYPGVAVNNSVSPSSVAAPRVAECGEMKTWIIGVNWYFNDYVRLMFNYSQSDLGDYPVTPIPAGTSFPAGPKAGFDGATVRGFGMRAQVDW